jgi:heptosyltransferase-2
MAKVLVIGPSWVGDMVMAQALAKRLVARPEATEVHVVAPPWALPIVERMPEIARGWALGVPHGSFGLTERWRLGRLLRAERFDEAIVLPRSFKSALVPVFAGVPRRRGVLGEARFGLINEISPVKPKEGRTVDDFVALSGDLSPLQPSERPRLLAQPVGPVLQRLGAPSGPFAVLCPGAEYGPAKRWPAGHFAALADRLGAAGLACLVIGSAKDGEAARAIAAASPSAVDLTGRTTLTDAVDLLAAAEVVVTNDSGLMHVAAAVDRPVVALYGSSSAARTPPLSERAAVVETEEALACRPCFARECRFGHTRCLTAIAAERVAAVALAQRAGIAPAA